MKASTIAAIATMTTIICAAMASSTAADSRSIVTVCIDTISIVYYNSAAITATAASVCTAAIATGTATDTSTVFARCFQIAAVDYDIQTAIPSVSTGSRIP